MSKIDRIIMPREKVAQRVAWTGEDITTEGWTQSQLLRMFDPWQVPTPWLLNHNDVKYQVWCNNFKGAFNKSCGYFIEIPNEPRTWLDFRDVIESYEREAVSNETSN